MSHLTLSFLFALGTFAFIYMFWLRPILKKNPPFRELYATTGSYPLAVRKKFHGIRQKFTAAILTFISLLVLVQDYVAPAMMGVDISPLISHLPNWVWPLIVIGFTGLMNYFRHLADERSDRQIGVLTTAIDDPVKVSQLMDTTPNPS